MATTHRKLLGFEYKRVGNISQLTFRGRFVYRRVGAVRAIFDWVF